jgi:hypothetical protein
MSAEISQFVLELLLLCTSVLFQRPVSAQLGTAAGVAALCKCVKSVHLLYILGRAQSSVRRKRALSKHLTGTATANSFIVSKRCLQRVQKAVERKAHLALSHSLDHF